MFTTKSKQSTSAIINKGLPLAALLLFAAGVAADQAKSNPSDENGSRGFSAEQLVRGGKLFQQYCAGCHGDRAQGAPNWSQRGPDGKFGPPPLNGTGHAWHHPKSMLIDTIKHGTLKSGGSMPPWKDTITDEQIDEVLGWLVSLWPEEAYQAWLKQTGHKH